MQWKNCCQQVDEDKCRQEHLYTCNDLAKAQKMAMQLYHALAGSVPNYHITGAI